MDHGNNEIRYGIVANVVRQYPFSLLLGVGAWLVVRYYPTSARERGAYVAYRDPQCPKPSLEAYLVRIWVAMDHGNNETRYGIVAKVIREYPFSLQGVGCLVVRNPTPLP